ncbi:ABC transporter substrate-binding protein [Halomonas sp. SpR8]|uniref:ABC transporter substrate-binding protein n=1 Tax=Halomonas sp. SpR8 TaxID=3050463 RepID=UPI0027E3C776|nr:ABC transporter substrate-binding protein [Halomonas sp. SpR8]MDQ7727803.1 ABC transporter substrate-binding protein [Halomonas sp. SpR8]
MKFFTTVLAFLTFCSIAYAGERQPIATFDWAVSETLSMLDIGPLGVTQLETYNEWANNGLITYDAIDLGFGSMPNLELMSHLNPSLIIGGLTRPNEKLSHIAPTENISLFPITGDPWQAVQDFTLALAERLGRQEHAKRLILEYEQQLSRLSHKLSEEQAPLLIIQFRDDRHVWIYGGNSLLQGVLDQLGLTNAWNQPTNHVGVSVVSIDELPAIEGRLVVLKSPHYTDSIGDRLNRGGLWQALLRLRSSNTIYLPVNYWTLGGLPSAMRFAETLVETLDLVNEAPHLHTSNAFPAHDSGMDLSLSDLAGLAFHLLTEA